MKACRQEYLAAMEQLANRERELIRMRRVLAEIRRTSRLILLEHEASGFRMTRQLLADRVRLIQEKADEAFSGKGE